MKYLLLCVAFVVAQVASAQSTAPGTANHSAATESHCRLKPFELHTVDGKETVNLQTLAGKVVVLDFFFPTCAECVIELPYLSALEKKHHSDKFAMYLVNIVPEQDSKVAPMLRKAQCTLPALHTDTMPWAIHWIGKENWGPWGAPETLLIDPDGRIVGHLRFNTAKNRALADQKVAALLGTAGMRE